MGWSRWVTCSAVCNSTGLVGSLHTGLWFVISVVFHGPGEKWGQLHGVMGFQSSQREGKLEKQKPVTLSESSGRCLSLQ